MSNLRGIYQYHTENGMPAMMLYYWSDPDKDPATSKGAIWEQNEINSYPGGRTGSAFQQEMLCRFDVRDTSRVWPDFEDWANDVTVTDFDIRQYDHWPIYVGYDYGPQEPHAFVAIAFASKTECYQIDEIYMRSTSIRDLVEVIKAKPYFERIRGIYADPSIWHKNQQQDDGETTSVGHLFEDRYDMSMERGQNFVGSDAAFIHLLNSTLWEKDHIKFKIFASCVNTLRELRLLAWSAKVTSGVNNKSRIMETIESREVHAFDALKYVMLELWKGVAPQQLGSPVGSVDWDIAQMERMKDTFQYVLNG